MTYTNAHAMHIAIEIINQGQCSRHIKRNSWIRSPVLFDLEVAGEDFGLISIGVAILILRNG